nr:hypothetical protein [Tanacetum cinerariifolium]
MANLIQGNKHLEERLDSHRSCLYKLENLNIPQQVSKAVDEIVTDAVDCAIQALLQNRFRDFPEADIKEILHQQMWETNSYKAHEHHMMLYEALEKLMNHDHTNELLTDLAEARRKKKKRHDSPKTPPGSPPHQPPPPQPLAAWTTTNTRVKPSVSSIPEDLHMDDDTASDEQVHSSDDKDIGNAHIPKTGDMAIFMDWFCKKQGITELKPQDLEGPAFDLVKTFHPNMWIEEECKYDIAAMYAISYWWFQRQRFYIDRYISEGDRRAIRTHMRILSVVRIEVFSMDKYEVQMIMRFNEIHKFSDDTLHQIDEALDYRVKEFKVNRMNPGLNTWFWIRKDVDRSKEFSEDGNPARANIKQAPGSDARLIFKSISHKSVGFNSLVHSLRALSTLRCSGLRTARAAAKLYQGDSSEFYLITDSIHTVSHIVEDFVKRLRSTLGEEGDHYKKPTDLKIQEMVNILFRGSLLITCLTIYMYNLRGSVSLLLLIFITTASLYSNAQSHFSYYASWQTSNALHNAIMEAGGKDRPPLLTPVAEGSTEITTERYTENYKNVTQDIRDQLNDEAEAVQIILTGIDNDIYSTVDACPNACEM